MIPKCNMNLLLSQIEKLSADEFSNLSEAVFSQLQQRFPSRRWRRVIDRALSLNWSAVDQLIREFDRDRYIDIGDFAESTKHARRRIRRKLDTALILRAEKLEPRVLLSASPSPIDDIAGSDALNFSVDADAGLIVKWRNDAMARAVDKELSDLASSMEYFTTPGLVKVELAENVDLHAAIEAFGQNPNVEFVEPDYRITLDETPDQSVTPIDARFDSLVGLHNTGQDGGLADADIDAPEAWAIQTGSPETVIAVIDTGIDYNHPDLAANIWINEDEIPDNGIDDDNNGFIDDVRGWNFLDDNNDPMDKTGHGTKVAGTIGAIANDRGVVGVNHHVRLMPIRFTYSSYGRTSLAIRSLEYAVANGASISNNSWGTSRFSAGLMAAIENARDAGHIFVASAGNDQLNADLRNRFPANYEVDSVVSVAATDNRDQLARFSSYGHRTVDLAAPGVNILSTSRDGGYSTRSGTSMAAPHVTGIVGLIKSQFPTWSYREIIDQLHASVDVIPGLAGKTSTSGRANAASALDANIKDRGRIQFERSTFGIGNSIAMTVTDHNAGTAAEVTLSTSSGDVERLTLQQVANGIYRGHVSSTNSADGNGTEEQSGQLEISASDVVTATYFDQSNHTGNSSTATSSADFYADDHAGSFVDATVIGIDSSTIGMIEHGDDADYFQFNAVAGVKYRFVFTSNGLDTSYFAAYRSDELSPLKVEQSAHGRSSELSWRSYKDEEVFLVVSSHRQATGGYQLRVTPVDDDHVDSANAATTINIGSTLSGDIEHVGDADYFRITAEAGASYVAQTHQNGTSARPLPDSTLTVYDSDGMSIVAYDNNLGADRRSRVKWTAEDNGDYFVAVRGYPGLENTGHYQISVTSIEDDHGDSMETASQFFIGEPVQGELEVSYDKDYFQFNAVARQKYVFDLTAESFEPYVSIIDHLGGYHDSFFRDEARRFQWSTSIREVTQFASLGTVNTH